MSKQATVRATAANWRESASMIILAKDAILNKDFDFKTLLFKRHATASFMPNSYVFPGGVREAADESPLWLQHFRKFGLSDEMFLPLTVTRGPRPPIFKSNGEGNLQKEISLRITAIRETFEEVGIIFGRDRKSFADASHCGYGYFREDFDREHWQHLVHNDPGRFLTLCQELDIVPDLWSLHEWSDWLTPSAFKKRFETVFFLVAVSKIPSIIVEKNEVEDFSWKSPYGYLKAYQKKKLGLPPPQFYELSRLLNISELEQLRNFACERAAKGTTLMLPVWYKCTNGSVSLLPGDDMYPDDPNAICDVIDTHMSIQKFRTGVKRLHRSEFSKEHRNADLHLNFPLPDGQLSPVVVNLHGEI